MRSTGKSRYRRESLEAAVRSALVDGGVAPDARILVGVSGGPDSTALLAALAALRGKWRFSLSACIVDHGIRAEEEIDGDVAFARSLCASLEVPLSVARVPRGQCLRTARGSRRSPEEVAREARYVLLREAARGAGAEVIALGHTRDDVMETLLMRIFQGSDVGGLEGIPLRRGSIVRPLLRCARADVLRYLWKKGLGWREDSTNGDTAILRNRIRRILAPVLEQVFPGYAKGILALSGKLSLVGQHLRQQASLLPWEKTRTGFSIPRETFFSAPQAVRVASLLDLYDALRGPDSPRRLPWRFLSPALAPAAPAKRGRILRGHGVALSERDGWICWEADIASVGKKSYFIEVSGAGCFVIRGRGMHVDVTRTCDGERNDDGEIRLRERELSPPLVLRSRRKGDAIVLENGAESLKELFARWKVSEGDREAVPVLADRNGVLAVLGGALGYENRARAGVLAGNGENVERLTLRACRDTEERREQ